MNKLMKIPGYIPFFGLIISIVLVIISAHIDSSALLIVGLILLHITAWISAIQFFICGIGFFSSVLGSSK